MLKPAEEAAMTSAPRLLMADWIRMLDKENIMLWTPEGTPIRSISFKTLPSIRSSPQRTDTSPSSRSRETSSIPAPIRLEVTVAMATPATSRCTTMTRNRFRSTLAMPETIRHSSGVRVSPLLRKMADSKLYSRITGIPKR